MDPPPNVRGRSLRDLIRLSKRGQFQAFDKTPDRAHAMIVPREFLPADRTPLDLASLRGAKPRHRLATIA